ncbi:MAG TPA: DUF4296 domain-containing protein, partial [Bacteroidales bacterium]|nr:DUF4296 domain-containing protein [Bacteroidales bacterium]
MKKDKCLFLMITVLLFIGCIQPKEKKPGALITPRKMAEILTDLQIADAWIAIKQNEGQDIKLLSTQIEDSLFKKHHITRAQFDTSMVWYSAHAEELDKIYDQVIQQLELLKEQ